MADNAAFTRDHCRVLWAKSPLTYADLTRPVLERLRNAMDDAMRRSGALGNTMRMRRVIRIVNWHKPDQRWCALRCRSRTFDDREAVTFNPDGFVGFGGWADDQNIQPILEGFANWLAREIALKNPSTTPKQLHILQHALGLDQYGQGAAYRNHFVTGEGSKDYADCVMLVGIGHMIRRDGSALTGGDDLFIVTRQGKQAVKAESPEPPKLTRSQQRYLDWLAVDGSESFGDWLKRKARMAKNSALVGAAMLSVVILGLDPGISPPAQAHEAMTGWKYEAYYCNGDGQSGDCQQIASERVRITSEGYLVEIRPGDHRLATVHHLFRVPQAEARRSHDEFYHLCLYPKEDTLRCFYVPDTGS